MTQHELGFHTVTATTQHDLGFHTVTAMTKHDQGLHIKHTRHRQMHTMTQHDLGFHTVTTMTQHDLGFHKGTAMPKHDQGLHIKHTRHRQIHTCQQKQLKGLSMKKSVEPNTVGLPHAISNLLTKNNDGTGNKKETDRTKKTWNNIAITWNFSKKIFAVVDHFCTVQQIYDSISILQAIFRLII